MKYARIKMKTIKKNAIHYHLPSILSSGCSKLAPRCSRNPNRARVLSHSRFIALPFSALCSLLKMRSRASVFLFSFSCKFHKCDISHMRFATHEVKINNHLANKSCYYKFQYCKSHVRYFALAICISIETQVRYIAHAILPN